MLGFQPRHGSHTWGENQVALVKKGERAKWLWWRRGRGPHGFDREGTEDHAVLKEKKENHMVLRRGQERREPLGFG